MIEIEGLVVAGVSALGTLVQAYYSAKAKNREIARVTLNKAEERAREPLKIGAKRVAEVIDDRLLEALQTQIEIRNQKLIEAFRNDSISDIERENQVEAARIQICSFLDEVMKFNHAKLPTKRLQDLWVSNRCEISLNI